MMIVIQQLKGSQNINHKSLAYTNYDGSDDKNKYELECRYDETQRLSNQKATIESLLETHEMKITKENKIIIT